MPKYRSASSFLIAENVVKFLLCKSAILFVNLKPSAEYCAAHFNYFTSTGQNSSLVLASLRSPLNLLLFSLCYTCLSFAASCFLSCLWAFLVASFDYSWVVGGRSVVLLSPCVFGDGYHVCDGYDCFIFHFFSQRSLPCFFCRRTMFLLLLWQHTGEVHVSMTWPVFMVFAVEVKRHNPIIGFKQRDGGLFGTKTHMLHNRMTSII